MYLEDFILDTDALILKALASPKCHPKKNPTIDVALRAVSDTVTKHLIAEVSREVRVDVLDAVCVYEVKNGEYASIPEGDEHRTSRDDYESGIDDVVEAALEEYDDHLSADWLGKNTVDTRLWESHDGDRSLVQKFADSAAKEVHKNLKGERTPMQALANAGITQERVQELLSQHLNGERPMATDTNTFDAVIAHLHVHLGKDFDQLTVYDDVECVLTETDEILSGSAADRLGLSKEQTEALEVAALNMGDDAADEILQAVANHKPVSGRAKTKAQKEAKAEAKAEAQAGAIAPLVIQNLKECGAGDTAMAETIGVSRSTYTNYLKGKTPFAPDDVQLPVLRDEIVRRTNLMLAALGSLDGVEFSEVH